MQVDILAPPVDRRGRRGGEPGEAPQREEQPLQHSVWGGKRKLEHGGNHEQGIRKREGIAYLALVRAGDVRVTRVQEFKVK